MTDQERADQILNEIENNYLRYRDTGSAYIADDADSLIAAALAAVRAEEREACAKISDKWADARRDCCDTTGSLMFRELGDAIRARSEAKP